MNSHLPVSVTETTEGRETDYTLLVRQVEKALLENPENPKVRELLARRSVWEKLPADRALEWATLAQIAGLPDTALEIYGAAAGRDPKNAAVWEARIRLLDILDDRPGLARAVAAAGKHLPAEQVNAWLSREIHADTP
ncbi:MAG: DNA primase, partial [Desulfotignum sp.]